MDAQTPLKNKVITELLNGTLMTIKSIIPIDYNVITPRLITEAIKLNYRVQIGITGDIDAKLILTGEMTMFSLIGKKMYGMTLDNEMLHSFSGELGNMIAGGLSTNISQSGIIIDITSPTIISNETTISGYNRIIQLPITFKDIGKMNTYLFMK